MKEDLEMKIAAAERTVETLKSDAAKLEKQLVCDLLLLVDYHQRLTLLKHNVVFVHNLLTGTMM